MTGTTVLSPVLEHTGAPSAAPRKLARVALERLITALSRARALESALHEAGNTADFSLIDGMRVPLLAALLEKRAATPGPAGGPQTLLAVTATSRESEGVREAFSSYLPDATVLSLPAWETLPHERLSPSAETVGARLKALRTLDAWQKQPAAEREGHLIVVASVRAALQPLAVGLASVEPIVLTAKQRG